MNVNNVSIIIVLCFLQYLCFYPCCSNICFEQTVIYHMLLHKCWINCLLSIYYKESIILGKIFETEILLLKLVFVYMCVLEVCTGPDLAHGWEMIFKTGRAGPANEGWIFQRAGTWEVIFWTGQAGPAKREMGFLTVELGYKKRKTNNLTSESRLTKQRRSFETDR